MENNPKTGARLALAMLLVIMGCTSGPSPGSERAIVPSTMGVDGGNRDAPGRTTDDDAGQSRDLADARSRSDLPDAGPLPNPPDAGLADAADGGTTEPPAFVQQPTSVQVTSGAQATFTAVVVQAVSYQWRKNGVAIPGATSSIYSIAATAPGDEGTYDLVATNSTASVVSTPATLTVTPALGAPVITVQPAAVTAVAGDAGTLSAVAEANPAASYQWRKDGVPLPGKNAASLTFPYVLLSDAGSYDLVVSNALGQVTSAWMARASGSLGSGHPILRRSRWRAGGSPTVSTGWSRANTV